MKIKSTIIAKNEDETRKLGLELGRRAEPGQIIALIGDLGTGKTTLTKYIAEGLGITEVVSSPTFTVIKEYESGRMPLYHFDVYRVGDPDELFNIGAYEYFDGNGLCVIEWADLIEDYLPEERLDIKIKVVDEDVRVFIIKPYGQQYEEMCEAVL